MERYTTRQADGHASVPPERLADAMDRLAGFEDLLQDLEREQEELPRQLEQLRNQGREKTVQFRELLARKLTNTNLRLLLEQHRLL